jgi:heme oxygenase
MKMDALDRDAARLGIGNVHRPLPSFLPNDFASALGAMYVLEGSSLGGAVIARALSKIPEISETGAFDFYTFYGSELGSMWTSFGQIVVKFVEEHGQADALVESAKKTFESVQAVFSQSLESVA